ncbi:MAG: Xylose isomerase domain protein barrel [Candidatus Solibacter sp.]|jgi:sugar phosphate isomerase/epimerase|nr:Xylose isomerase domain protein barrel [Candidatus Solibacter sp.]
MKTETSRRNFLGAAAGVAGLSVIGAPSASAVVEAEPWGIKLGIATYSLRSFDRTTAIEMLKKMQVKYVSIKDIHMKIGVPPEETKAARAEFDAAGLVVTSGGNVDMTKGTTVDDLRKQFEYAKAARLPMMVCAPTHENIKAVETLVKEYDIRIAIHNHGPEDKHFPTPQSVLEVVRKLDKRCGLCMDIGHSARTGVDVVETIAGAGDRLFDMHVKDLSDLKVKESQVDIGDGRMPFPRIFKQLKKMGYTGCVNMEYEINGKDPMMGMQRSLSYMRGVLAGLASA